MLFLGAVAFAAKQQRGWHAENLRKLPEKGKAWRFVAVLNGGEIGSRNSDFLCQTTLRFSFGCTE